MSANSVFDHLQQSRQGLLQKICQNEELASLVMGLMGRLIYVAEMEKNKPVTGMTFDDWVVEEGVWRSRVHFNAVTLARSHRWGPKRDFAAYVQQKAGKMAQALSDNPDMENWFQSLVESISNWADWKGYPFKDLVFLNHIITQDDVVVLKLGRRKHV